MRKQQILAGLLVSIAFQPILESQVGAVFAQNIIPARPEAIGGGNPFEGLGRPDDPNPSRRDEFEGKGAGATTNNSSDQITDNGNLSPGQNSPQNVENSATGATSPSSQPGAADQEAASTASAIGTNPSTRAPSEPDKVAKTKAHSLFDKTENDRDQNTPVSAMPEPMAKIAITALRQGKYEEAVKNLETLSRIHPQAPEIDYLMGIALTMTCRFPQAIEHYKKVVDSNAPKELKDLARSGLQKLEAN